MCMECGRQHDSWRAYCTNCMQTQTMIRHMDQQAKEARWEANRNARRQAEMDASYRSYNNSIPQDPVTERARAIIADALYEQHVKDLLKSASEYKGKTAVDVEREIIAEMNAPLSQKIRKFFSKFW